ncbi:chitin deacetylase 7-like [Hetaerina americana]|uniref:chitin deacetylase 7-like n=1 Tax=Hetaerina americana TaxID=62018 RepID=UPI003A7F5A4E
MGSLISITWLLTYTIIWLLAANGALSEPLSRCDDSASPEANCKLPKCRCYSSNIPGALQPGDTPQLVMLTFDGPVTMFNYENYYAKSLFNRRNPNKCNISATFFTTHVDNDYWLTNELYRQGHEIALHTISHPSDLSNWANASVERLEEEFIGQMKILNTFGLIPMDSMRGLRNPHLQMSGDNTFKLMFQRNLTWDSSWPTHANLIDHIIWPYTLDFKSPQDCPIPPCPKSSFPGRWVVPIVAWINENTICSTPETCPNISTEGKILQFMKDNFHRHYDGNRAPFPLLLHADWFSAHPFRFRAYKKFLDYLATQPGVYIVTISQVIEWIQNPTPLSKMNKFWKCWKIPKNTCHPQGCKLMRINNGEEYYMESCVDCPDVYPWLGVPDGKWSSNIVPLVAFILVITILILVILRTCC